MYLGVTLLIQKAVHREQPFVFCIVPWHYLKMSFNNAAKR